MHEIVSEELSIETKKARKVIEDREEKTAQQIVEIVFKHVNKSMGNM